MRLAWFSPLPPSTSGIAAYSSEILPRLEVRGCEIDTCTAATAHEFVWRHRRQPYDLAVYQLGNASCHDFMWAYLFRYPGLVVLHDAQLHQARALFLTKRWQPRLDDYMAEVRANHPDAPPDLPYLVLARMGDRMYQHWPLLRLVLERAKATLVHNEWVAHELRDKHPNAVIRALSMGVAEPVTEPSMVRHVRQQFPGDAVVVAAYGGVTREKRIPQLIRVIAPSIARNPNIHVLLVGAAAADYDVMADARALGIAKHVHLTGFVSDADLPAYLHAADVCACLRWPTNRETSASWLRCIAAARPTIVTELAHMADVPTLDPRGWRVLSNVSERRQPIAVSIDPLDEDHSLQLALERLVSDATLRALLGRAAREWWRDHHQLDQMADRYIEVLRDAVQAPVPASDLPPHLLDDGTSALRRAAQALEVGNRLDDLL